MIFFAKMLLCASQGIGFLQNTLRERDGPPAETGFYSSFFGKCRTCTEDGDGDKSIFLINGKVRRTRFSGQNYN